MNEMRHCTGYIEKAAAKKDIDGTFVMSSADVDRVGDIIEQDGWDLRAFKKNAIALWQHSHDKPIGAWKNVRVEGDKLIGDLKLATTNLARMAKQLIDDGVLKAVSVGFRPIEYESRDPENDEYGLDGLVIKKAELLECSLVSVGANQSALLLSKKFGLSASDRRLIFSPSQREKTSNATSGDEHPAVARAHKDLAEIRALLGK